MSLSRHGLEAVVDVLGEAPLAGAQHCPSEEGRVMSAIRVRKNWNRARLVEVGSSWTRPENSAA